MKYNKPKQASKIAIITIKKIFIYSVITLIKWNTIWCQRTLPSRLRCDFWWKCTIDILWIYHRAKSFVFRISGNIDVQEFHNYRWATLAYPYCVIHQGLRAFQVKFIIIHNSKTIIPGSHVYFLYSGWPCHCRYKISPLAPLPWMS